jgi:chemotaxis protein methyltransferase CheR
LRSRVAQAVTVQESYFFRDKVPFHYFIDVMLPKLMAKREGQRRIRVWCAAAATGQEPYSLVMELAERDSKLAGWTVEIVATDFVEDALEKARKGLYSQFEVQRGCPSRCSSNISTRSETLGRSAPTFAARSSSARIISSTIAKRSGCST